MMMVRHQGGNENDGSARRALLIFVPWSPALPNQLVSPPPHSLNLLPIRSYVSIGASGFPYKLPTPLQPHLIRAWTSRGRPIRTVSFSLVLSWQTFPPPRPSLFPQLPNKEIPRLCSSSASSTTISELAANTLIGVDTCAISTDADALTIHPLRLVQEANGYPAKETRKE